MSVKRIFLYLLIGSVGLSAALGIAVILFGNFGSIEVRIIFTTLTITVTSVFGLACGAFLESGRGKYLPVSGIALSIAAALMCFRVIWDVLDDSEVFIKCFVTATILAASCAHISLLSLARLDSRFSWTRIAAIVCMTILDAIVLYIIWFEPDGESDVVYRALGVLGIFLASLTVVTPVLHRLSYKEGDVAQVDAKIAVLESGLAVLRRQRDEMLATEVERD